MEKTFPHIYANIYAPEQQWISGYQRCNYQHQRTALFERLMQELLYGEATFYPVMTVQVILEIPPDCLWNN